MFGLSYHYTCETLFFCQNASRHTKKYFKSALYVYFHICIRFIVIFKQKSLNI